MRVVDSSQKLYTKFSWSDIFETVRITIDWSYHAAMKLNNGEVISAFSESGGELG